MMVGMVQNFMLHFGMPALATHLIAYGCGIDSSGAIFGTLKAVLMLFEKYCRPF
jgi:hypothetical protein